MYIVMMTKEGSTKILTFMTPKVVVLLLGCGHISYSENTLFLSTPRHRSDKLSWYKVMITKEGSTKIVNFMTPRVGVLMLGMAI